MNALNVPRPDRRGSLTAPAAAAAGLAASDAQTAVTAPGSGLIEAVLVAFQAHRVVAIGDAHATSVPSSRPSGLSLSRGRWTGRPSG